ncbi:hypothetical protein [Streptodolium elevatio]|uniref:Uncharacterized protein n=1 Tax=Streptodolium elevatio TaxID=3157996 RepID=A0ABV3DCY0_9ACTN
MTIDIPDETPREQAIANGWGWVLGVKGQKQSAPTNRQRGAKRAWRTKWAKRDVMRWHHQVADVVDRLRTMPYAEHREDTRLVEAGKHLQAAERCLFFFHAGICTIEPPKYESSQAETGDAASTASGRVAT